MITVQPSKHAVDDDQVRELWHGKASVDSFLAEMRGRGAWQIESIRAVRICSGIPLGDAKEVVHYSPVWCDKRAESEALHEAAWEALDILQKEQETEIVSAH